MGSASDPVRSTGSPALLWLPALGHADIVLDQREWQAISEPRPGTRRSPLNHIDLPGLRWRPVAPQPTDDPDLAGFAAAYHVVGERAALRATTRAVNRLGSRHTDLVTRPAHDPAAGARLSASSWGRARLGEPS